jgi:phage tail sheath protein FI
MTNYKTPNVYVEEISTLGSSIVGVSTGIPAFIGYTERVLQNNGENLSFIPTKITSIFEYEKLFGKTKSVSITFSLDKDNEVENVKFEKLTSFMYYSVQMFFYNGGESCYIVSVGADGTQKNDDGDTTSESTDLKNMENGLISLEAEDEPTLILLTDGIFLRDPEYYTLCENALQHCSNFKDRFAIFDVPLEEPNNGNLTGIDKFRTQIGMNNLNYGAAYYPHLLTSLNYYYTDDSILVDAFYFCSFQTTIMSENDGVGLLVTYVGHTIDQPLVILSSSGAQQMTPTISFDPSNEIELHITLQEGGNTVEDILNAWEKFQTENRSTIESVDKFTIESVNEGATNGIIDEDTQVNDFEQVQFYLHKTDPNGLLVSHSYSEGKEESPPIIRISLVEEEPDNEEPDNEDMFIVGSSPPTLTIKTIKDESIENIINNWNTFSEDKGGFHLEKSGDGSVSLQEDIQGQTLKLQYKSACINLSEYKSNTNIYNKIKSQISKYKVIMPPSGAIAGIYSKVDRERGVWKAPANVSLSSVTAPIIKITDTQQKSLNVDDTGKSINAIRYFTGKGVLVWGARTLDGNNNEWRYVPVRRLFIYVEESIKKGTAFAVFEPNNNVTWQKVKSMIDNFLEDLWRQGALMGTKPKEAFFVNVGLGLTMSLEDVLEGRMIVEIGIAAVRPAEFIILKFSHKLEEA